MCPMLCHGWSLSHWCWTFKFLVCSGIQNKMDIQMKLISSKELLDFLRQYVFCAHEFLNIHYISVFIKLSIVALINPYTVHTNTHTHTHTHTHVLTHICVCVRVHVYIFVRFQKILTDSTFKASATNLSVWDLRLSA